MWCGQGFNSLADPKQGGEHSRLGFDVVFWRLGGKKKIGRKGISLKKGTRKSAQVEISGSQLLNKSAC